MKALHDKLEKGTRSHPNPVHALKMTSHTYTSINPAGKGGDGLGSLEFLANPSASCRDRDTGARPGRRSHEAQLGLQIKGATGEDRGIYF
jgi:hypothetical protein